MVVKLYERSVDIKHVVEVVIHIVHVPKIYAVPNDAPIKEIKE